MPQTQSTGEILTIRQLAEYLMVSEKTVYRMLERNQLPALRVGAQWRFRKQDIDSWLTDEMRRVEYEGKSGALEAESAIAIAPLLAPENVWLGLKPAPRDELLGRLIHESSLDAHVDREQLLRSILEREALSSTAVLPAAAFPHPVDPRPFRFSRKRVLLAVFAEPLDIHDPQGHRPRVIAVLLARSIQGQLLALSRAIRLFADPALLDQLCTARSAEAAIEFVAATERALA